MITTAHRQWATRPADEKFQTIDDLEIRLSSRKRISIERNAEISDLTVAPTTLEDMFFGDVAEITQEKEDEKGDIVLMNNGKELWFNHWSFGQVCLLAKAPAQYMRTLTPYLISQCLNYSLPKVQEKIKLLTIENGSTELRATTSINYGRIWDIELIRAVRDMISANPSWHNPLAIARAGVYDAGLYASDRDVFMFFIDEDHIVEVNGEGFHRGFFAWNSETGKTSFGLSTFLYDRVVGTHYILGSEGQYDIRIRHSSGAPDRAFKEILPRLRGYIESTTDREKEIILKAKNHEIIDTTGKMRDECKEGVIKWLMQRSGFTRSLASHAYDYAEEKIGNPINLWDIVRALALIARDKEHIDARVDLERQAGKLIGIVK